MKIIDGRNIARENLIKIKRSVNILKSKNITSKLAVVLVGDDKASISYIKNKEDYCSKAGISFELFKFPQNIKEGELSKKINIIQRDKDLSGLIIQLPLPKRINKYKILDLIDNKKDVDCLTSYNLGKLTAGNPVFLPPTAAAIIEILDRYKVNYKNKHIVVVGRGELVGKPLGIMLTQRQNTVTMCGRHTKNLKFYTKQADILISAVGKKNLINGNMIKRGVVIIDAGIMVESGKVYGDVNFKKMKNKPSLITPVPGGIGPVTVSKLLENVLICTQIKN